MTPCSSSPRATAARLAPSSMVTRWMPDAGPGASQSRQNPPVPATRPRTTTARISRLSMLQDSVDGLQDQRGVGPAKSEAVVERCTDLALLGLVRDQIDAFGALARIVEIQRRWDNLIADRENAEDRLHCAGATQQMADRRLGRTHRNLADRIAEQALDGAEFNRVSHGRSAVGIDIVDVAWRHARLLQRHLHRSIGAKAIRMRR